MSRLFVRDSDDSSEWLDTAVLKCLNSAFAFSFRKLLRLIPGYMHLRQVSLDTQFCYLLSWKIVTTKTNKNYFLILILHLTENFRNGISCEFCIYFPIHQSWSLIRNQRRHELPVRSKMADEFAIFRYLVFSVNLFSIMEK